MAFKKANQTGLVEHLVDQIQEAIVSGQYRPGEKLPSSRELEEMLGASRGTLREALRILAHKGLIEVRTGAKGGVFAKQVGTEAVIESLGLLIHQREIPVEDLYGFRKVVEEALVRLVVEKALPEDVEELKALLEEMKALVPHGQPYLKKLFRVERRIRGVFIRVSASKMYESVLNAIWYNLRSYADLYLPGEDSMLDESYEDWRIIIASIERGDADTAAERTRDHLHRFMLHYRRGFDRFHEQKERDAGPETPA